MVLASSLNMNMPEYDMINYGYNMIQLLAYSIIFEYAEGRIFHPAAAIWAPNPGSELTNGLWYSHRQHLSKMYSQLIHPLWSNSSDQMPSFLVRKSWTLQRQLEVGWGPTGGFTHIRMQSASELGTFHRQICCPFGIQAEYEHIRR